MLPYRLASNQCAIHPTPGRPAHHTLPMSINGDTCSALGVFSPAGRKQKRTRSPQGVLVTSAMHLTGAPAGGKGEGDESPPPPPPAAADVVCCSSRCCARVRTPLPGVAGGVKALLAPRPRAAGVRGVVGALLRGVAGPPPAAVAALAWL
jgi:hypothetical protein